MPGTWLAALLVLVAGPALAAPGVIEISQARALAGGVTPGDGPGFPVTLSEPGSYALASSLVVSATNTTGIDVAADSVAIDLNGFAIVGPVACSGRGAAVTCTPMMSGGNGIGFVGYRHVSVRNGFVHGFVNGIAGSSDCHVEEVIANRNQEYGILIGAGGCVFLHVIASENRASGIDAGAGCEAIESVAFANRGDGVLFRAEQGLLRGNNARRNGGSGLRAGAGSTVTRNLASDNGESGIEAAYGSLVEGNLMIGNQGYQLVLSLDAAFHRNVIATPATAAGTVDGGVYLDPNVCNGLQSDASCRFDPTP
jgi:hypothetical protein